MRDKGYQEMKQRGKLNLSSREIKELLCTSEKREVNPIAVVSQKERVEL